MVSLWMLVLFLITVFDHPTAHAHVMAHPLKSLIVSYPPLYPVYLVLTAHPPHLKNLLYKGPGRLDGQIR